MIMRGVSQTWFGFPENVDRSWENVSTAEELLMPHRIHFSPLLRPSMKPGSSEGDAGSEWRKESHREWGLFLPQEGEKDSLQKTFT